MIRRGVRLTMLWLLCAAPVAAQSPTLVSTEELANLLARSDSGIRVIDARNDYTLYLQSHIPGAVYLNTEELRAWDRGAPNLVLPLDSYRVLFSRLGVRMNRPVVVYSAGEVRDIDATYVAWILQGLGHPAVRLLNGGLGKWEVENRATTRRYPSVPATDFAPAAFTPDRATLDDARDALGRSDVILVDARNPEQYAGLAGAQLRRGHIPGAINHFWQQDLVKPDFATVWRSSEDLRLAYAAQGITPEKQVVAYCNGGLESSHVYFALHNVLGYPRVRVYDGSFTEWSERTELPVTVGNEP
jgi:thiosulfate/3-mercaptopyruvate sulfurtransferase